MEIIRYLTQPEKHKTRILYEAAFPEDSGPFVDYYYQWKTADNRILVMEEEGRIQVMIHLNPYDFQICGSGWQIPYIVAVATRPDCRRQGKMGRVMERLLQDLEQQNCPFTILLPADPAYYEGQGFVFFPRQNEWELPPVVSDLKAAELEWRQDTANMPELEWKQDISDMPKPERRQDTADMPELEWRQAKEADIAELVRLSNDILQKKSQIFAVRDRAYYQRLLEETRVEHGGVLLLTSEEKICGILVSGLEAEEKPAAEIKELLLKLPSGEQAAEFLCQKALPDCEISFSRPRMMFRVASLEAFVSMLKSENPRSFTVKVRDSAVKANCGYFQITLNREGGRLERITDSCRKIPEFRRRLDAVSSGRQEPVSEKIQEMDISRLAVELLQDVSLDFREWV